MGGGKEALVVTYLLVFSISYMSENVRKIHLRPHLSLYHTETSAFLWQRPWISELEYDRKVILLQICSTKQGLSLHKICVKCLTQVKLNRAFRPNSSTHNTKKIIIVTAVSWSSVTPCWRICSPTAWEREHTLNKLIHWFFCLFRIQMPKSPLTCPSYFSTLRLEKLNWENIITKRGD